jgi:hypothetical protein
VFFTLFALAQADPWQPQWTPPPPAVYVPPLAEPDLTIDWEALERAVAEDAEVTAYKKALTRFCYDPGPIDGDWGPKTEAALAAFQGDYDTREHDGQRGHNTEWTLGIDDEICDAQSRSHFLTPTFCAADLVMVREQARLVHDPHTGLMRIVEPPPPSSPPSPPRDCDIARLKREADELDRRAAELRREATSR